ncbi:hypothetical protein BJX61DRAFT_258474 [Aspergillus egyptiacus]|nr:hypothetical protein BJX61DRAFT_258474 [Aspergillus egyptiacus]
MRSDLLLLAGLASSALALPTAASTDLDPRFLGGLVGGLLDVVKDLVEGLLSPLDILGDITGQAAAALGSSALGCKAGSVDHEYRKALALWLNTEAGLRLDASLRKSLLDWCSVDLDLDVDLNSGLDLDLDIDLRAQLAFLLPTVVHVAAEADLSLSLDGVVSLVGDVVGVLTATAQSALEAAIGLLGDLDWKVKAGLEFCASGGVVADLDIEILKALKVWLNSEECGLSVELKKTVLLWLEGKIGGDVIELPKLPVGGVTAISLGNSIEALVDAGGALVASAQASLATFLETSVGLEIDVEIKALLELCAKGGLAIDLDYDKRVELALWLISDKCTLTAELKSLLIFWLSLGVSADVDVSLDLSDNLVTDLLGLVTGTLDGLLGTHLSGLLSFLTSGESVLAISLEARAQLAALLGGSLDLDLGLDLSLKKIILGWLVGCHECCGKPRAEFPGLPSSTPSSGPGGVQPTETPSKPTQTPVKPTGVQPTETTSKPTGSPAHPTEAPGSETPEDEEDCEEIVTSSVTSSVVHPTETPAHPTEAPSSEAPEDEEDCEEIVTSSVTSSIVHPTETPAQPSDVVPTGVSPSDTPCSGSNCQTQTFPTGIPSSTSIPGGHVTQPPVAVPTPTGGGKKTVTVTKTVAVEVCPTSTPF